MKQGLSNDIVCHPRDGEKAVVGHIEILEMSARYIIQCGTERRTVSAELEQFRISLKIHPLDAVKVSEGV